MKVTNKDRKPLSKNQKIIAIIFIVFGGLFLLNEIAFRIDQAKEPEKPEWLQKYCSELLRESYESYTKDKDCNK